MFVVLGILRSTAHQVKEEEEQKIFLVFLLSPEVL
jgi:hypothetical protein